MAMEARSIRAAGPNVTRGFWKLTGRWTPHGATRLAESRIVWRLANRRLIWAQIDAVELVVGHIAGSHDLRPIRPHSTTERDLAIWALKTRGFRNIASMTTVA